MPETIGESFVNQLKQYYQQKPAREPAVNRGHQARNFKGGKINRLRPIIKRESISFKVATRLNDTTFVSVVPPFYNVVTNDYYLSVAVGLGVIVNLLPAATATIGKVVIIKDATGGCGGLTPIQILPAGADTLDTFPGALLMIIPFQVLSVMSDGVGNWEII